MEEESLAAVKAAAWAWYQHGSGGKSPTQTEYAATRTFRTHGPSRFKPRLIFSEDDNTTVRKSMARPSSSVGVGHSSDLLDAYEIMTIKNQIDFLITGSRALSPPPPPGRGTWQRKKKSEKRHESRLLGAKIRSHGVICGGSRNDVVEPLVFHGGRLRSDKHQAFVSDHHRQS